MISIRAGLALGFTLRAIFCIILDGMGTHIIIGVWGARRRGHIIIIKRVKHPI
jgi:hypothetical protein